MIKSISPAGLNQLVSFNKDVQVLDVRSREEYELLHIPFATHVPLESIESGSFNLEPEKILITLCAKGAGRSERAAAYFLKTFPNQVYVLEGGTLGWFEQSWK